MTFRPVAVTRPDLQLVLRAQCAAAGLRAPAVLALRLKQVAEMTRDQMYVSATGYHFLCTEKRAHCLVCQ